MKGKTADVERRFREALRKELDPDQQRLSAFCSRSIYLSLGDSGERVRDCAWAGPRSGRRCGGLRMLSGLEACGGGRRSTA